MTDTHAMTVRELRRLLDLLITYQYAGDLATSEVAAVDTVADRVRAEIEDRTR